MIEINLLPKEYRKRAAIITFDKKFLYIGAAAAVLLLVIGGSTIYQKYQLSKLDGMIAKARVEENRYRKDLELIDALTEVKVKILERLDAVDRLDQRRDFYVSMLEDFNRRVPEFLWMTSFIETPPVPAGKAGDSTKVQTTNPDIGHARISGYAFSLNSIGSFMIGLMKSDYFDNIRLGHTVQEYVANVQAYNFELTCDLNYGAAEMMDEFEDLSDEGLELSARMDTYQDAGNAF